MRIPETAYVLEWGDTFTPQDGMVVTGCRWLS